MPDTVFSPLVSKHLDMGLIIGLLCDEETSRQHLTYLSMCHRRSARFSVKRVWLQIVVTERNQVRRLCEKYFSQRARELKCLITYCVLIVIRFCEKLIVN